MTNLEWSNRLDDVRDSIEDLKVGIELMALINGLDRLKDRLEPMDREEILRILIESEGNP